MKRKIYEVKRNNNSIGEYNIREISDMLNTSQSNVYKMLARKNKIYNTAPDVQYTFKEAGYRYDSETNKIDDYAKCWNKEQAEKVIKKAEQQEQEERKAQQYAGGWRIRRIRNSEKPIMNGYLSPNYRH